MRVVLERKSCSWREIQFTKRKARCTNNPSGDEWGGKEYVFNVNQIGMTGASEFQWDTGLISFHISFHLFGTFESPPECRISIAWISFEKSCFKKKNAFYIWHFILDSIVVLDVFFFFLKVCTMVFKPVVGLRCFLCRFNKGLLLESHFLSIYYSSSPTEPEPQEKQRIFCLMECL